jgi:hypothetical protein
MTVQQTPRQTCRRPTLRVAAIAVLSLVLAAAVVRRIRIAAGMRRGDQAVIDAKRARNKRFANRLVTTLGRAGRRHSIFAIIHITGRHSGRRYATPIRVVEHADGFIVPLTMAPEPAGMSTCVPTQASCTGRDRPSRSATRHRSPPAPWPGCSHHRRGFCSGLTAPTSACASNAWAPAPAPVKRVAPIGVG